MNHGILRFGAWSGVAMSVMFLVAIVFVAGFLPPTPPSLESPEVYQLFQDNSVAIRAGMAIGQLGIALGFAFSGALAAWTLKMEGSTPALSFGQLVCAPWTFGAGYPSVIFFSAAAFRPDTSPEIVYLLNDLGWYWLVSPAAPAVVHFILCGLAILSDKREQPIFPRWVGYFNIWMGITQIPCVMMAFFYTGPFAWDGLFTWWIPLFGFSFWIYINAWAILQAVKRAEQGESFDEKPA